uniref:Uncharacterized protein n=1 Tax=Chlamydomonas leiostraca TaxID=1034604 RepID=A0A7S0RSD0_9CHLO|mmetsp:Transcript_3015/g.7490  ORF Transcript_3015/g.7490 Transcript_3015/m.7490 type:complete len:208 (+) Transcript_3015:112-735(+)|eukprot:CAMPEP_0202870438 /NCGR_PEP_ID=MMETSP1391-20130828/15786_1 /ASSEMBLY_ACC=CAM_ASM_000867 /TAXON_ID=1034604 /ORGANISM="Chlamydomonas leiostraca, Strain SAG 11-49" /LENGTH=207 /DNA_ID=CAMNT_0049551017 /DNA_START=34 /DNA_END=657 /DNA_ORIENTATION=+
MRAAKAAGSRKSSRGKLFRIKVISMGEQATGKSCLIKRYCEDKFIQKYIPTIGVDYGVKPVRLGDYELRVNLWDLAGAGDYIEVRNEFYKDAQGCLLVYDVTSRASFEALPAWLQEAKDCGAEHMVIIVAATKADNPTRRVTEKEGRDWAAAMGFPFFEVSASSGMGVRSLFSTLFARMLATIPGIPQEMAAQAVQSANAAREEEGL